MGVGTVYRVLPTQRAMLESVLEEEVRRLTDAAEEAHGRPDPASALVDFLRTALAAALARPGLIDVLITGSDETESLSRAKGELVAAVSKLLGLVRPVPALTGENLLKLLCGLCMRWGSIRWSGGGRRPRRISLCCGAAWSRTPACPAFEGGTLGVVGLKPFGERIARVPAWRVRPHHCEGSVLKRRTGWR
ncbi:hypothetical protein [Streptomyces rubiginosohelvolus]|uniref:hypothetical protein n=1 Tax=Streptomyces rubiginosohelvolus TaxID=67362 RepID=UPI0036A3D7EA